MKSYSKQLLLIAITFNITAANWTDDIKTVDTERENELKAFSESIMREIAKIDKVYLLVANQDAGSIDYLHVYEEHDADGKPTGSLIPDKEGF